MPIIEGLSLGTDKHSIVIEVGHAFTKVGFVHESSPRSILRSEIYSRSQERVVNLHDIKDEDQLYHALKEFIESLYFGYLAVNPKDRRVIIVESIFSVTKFRQTLARVFFNYFDVPGLLFVPLHLMSLMTLVINTGIIIDVGSSETSVIPVIEGVTLLNISSFSPLGSKAIHERILSDLKTYGAKISTAEGTRDFDPDVDKLDEKILEDMRVRTCFVANHERGQKLTQLLLSDDDGVKKEIKSSAPHDVKYPMGAGTKILTIPGIVRETSPQILFESVGHEANIPKMILDVIIKCPLNARKELSSNLVLIGGTCCMPGFKHRLYHDLMKMIQVVPEYQSTIGHFDTFKFHEMPCQENYAGWLGAAIFGSTDFINAKIITRDSYKKFGHSVLTDWSYGWWPSDRIIPKLYKSL